MHIELSDEQKMLQEEVRRFAHEVVQPIAKEVDADGMFPVDSIRQAGETETFMPGDKFFEMLGAKCPEKQLSSCCSAPFLDDVEKQAG